MVCLFFKLVFGAIAIVDNFPAAAASCCNSSKSDKKKKFSNFRKL